MESSRYFFLRALSICNPSIYFLLIDHKLHDPVGIYVSMDYERKYQQKFYSVKLLNLVVSVVDHVFFIHRFESLQLLQRFKLLFVGHLT
jgi:hypothetical protein